MCQRDRGWLVTFALPGQYIKTPYIKKMDIINTTLMGRVSVWFTVHVLTEVWGSGALALLKGI